MTVLLFVLLVGCAVNSEAVEVGDTQDRVVLTLLDHVMAVSQIGEEKARMAFVDSVVLIGNYHDESILDLQGGFIGTVKPESASDTGIDWIGQAFFKLHPFVRRKVKLAEHWVFLKSVEYGVVGGYNFTEKDWYTRFQIGLAFGITPKRP